MKVRLIKDHYFDELDLYLLEGTVIEAAVPKRDKDGKIVYEAIKGTNRKRPVIEKMGKVILVHPVKDPNEKFNRIAPTPPSLRELETRWIGPPSIGMEALDAEAEAAVAKRQETYMDISDLPIVPSQARQNVT